MPRSIAARGTTLAAVAIVAGTTLLVACGGNGSVPKPPDTSSSATTVRPTADRPASSATSRAGGIPPLSGGPTGPAHAAAPAPVSSAPVQVRIPAIAVSSSLQALGLEKDGTLQTPSAWQVAGWYAGGVRPGDTGPAVIAGHVDSVSGPAVFFRLRELHAGDRIYVRRANGSTVRFVVDSVAEYPKRVFPTRAVYGPSPVPTLRLVTCTGDFDRAQHSYVDNLVVTAYAG